MKTFYLSLMLVALTSTQMFADSAEFISLGFQPGFGGSSKAWGVSPNGVTVVGESKVIGSPTQAFRWTAVTGIELLEDMPGGSLFSTARAVTNNGAMITGRINSSSGSLATIWQSGSISTLGTYQSTGESEDHAIVATGVSADGSKVTAHNSSQALLWTNQNGLVPLGNLSSSGGSSNVLNISQDGAMAVGQSESALGTQALYWDLSDLSLHPLGELNGGQFFSVATGVNADGSVIVGQSDSDLGKEAFRWTVQSGMQGLGDLPGGKYESKAWAVSADGNTIVGQGEDSQGEVAFIWTSQAGMRSLQELLVDDFELNLTGWHLTQATSLSSDGKTITGFGTNPDGFTEAWVVKLPTTSNSIPGDANGDDRVDEVDLNMVLQNFGSQSSDGYGDGDFNQDNSTDLKDLLIVKQHFGQTLSTSPAAVPEPQAILLILTCILPFIVFRHRVLKTMVWQTNFKTHRTK